MKTAIYVVALLFLGFLTLAGFASADVIPDPTALSVEQVEDSIHSYTFRLDNTANVTETLTIHTPSFISCTDSIVLNPNEQDKEITFSIDTSSLSPTTYTLYIQFSGAQNNAVDYTIYLHVTDADEIDEEFDGWHMIADRERYDLYDLLEFGDYSVRIEEIRSNKALFKFYFDDELVQEAWVSARRNKTISEDELRIHVYECDEGDDVRISMWSDDDYDVDITSGDNDYRIPLLSNQQLSKGATLNFGTFYFTLDFIAYNGVYLNTGTGYQANRVQCIKGSDCFPHENIRLRIDSVSSDAKTITVTVDSKEDYLVSTTNQQLGSQCNYNQYCEYWLGEGQNCIDCGGTGVPGSQYPTQSSAGNMVIQLMGGSIAPGNKVYIYVTDSSNLAIQTGLVSVDAGRTPSLFDINNGIAKVDLPWDLTCPIGMTATASGYKTATQIFSTCSEKGRNITWDPLSPPQTTTTTTTLPENAPDMTVSHSGNARLGDSTIITVLYDGTAVSLANVQVTPPDNNIQTATTNSEGKISLTLDQTGQWKVLVKKTGYNDVEHNFNVDRKPLTIEFSPSSPKLKENVEAIFKSDGNSVSGLEAILTTPDRELTKTTTSNGRISFTTEWIGEYRVRSDSSEYNDVEQNFNVVGKEMQLTLSPENPTCGSTVNIIAKDVLTGYTITNSKIRVDGTTLSGSSWLTPSTEGSHNIAVEADEYTSKEISADVTCVPKLLIPPYNIEAGQSAYARWSADVSWMLVCFDSEGRNITFLDNSQIMNRTIDVESNCQLKWDDTTKNNRPFQVTASGWFSGWGTGGGDLGGGISWNHVIGALVIVVLIALAHRMKLLDRIRGGPSGYFQLGSRGGGGTPGLSPRGDE